MAESKLIKPDWHICPMPREFGFPLDKGDLWDDFYDLIRFPLQDFFSEWTFVIKHY